MHCVLCVRYNLFYRQLHACVLFSIHELLQMQTASDIERIVLRQDERNHDRCLMCPEDVDRLLRYRFTVV